jgi:hypothetical protein
MTCRICRNEELTKLLDAGQQPMSNRYVKRQGEAEDLRPLAVGQCPRCATIQLLSPASAADVLPRFSWITYKEPEAHLDDMVAHLVARPEVPAGCPVLGLSFKDESVLQRLEHKGHTTRLLDMNADLGIVSEGAGLESVQAALTPEKARELAAKWGRFPLVIARHIFEHAHDTRGFMEAVRELTIPGGMIVLEVPDSSRALAAPDYTVLWEEHILMLTPRAFLRATEYGGFERLWFQEYPYPNENSMVLFARMGKRDQAAEAVGAAPAEEFALGGRFASAFVTTRERILGFLNQTKAEGHKVAMFGAGHNACVFLNLYGLAEHVAFVADDHPHKVGLFMPGSQVPIRTSASLQEQNVAICLSSLSPESEDAVLTRNPAFVGEDVTYFSIYPASPRYFLRKNGDSPDAKRT